MWTRSGAVHIAKAFGHLLLVHSKQQGKDCPWLVSKDGVTVASGAQPTLKLARLHASVWLWRNQDGHRFVAILKCIDLVDKEADPNDTLDRLFVPWLFKNDCNPIGVGNLDLIEQYKRMICYTFGQFEYTSGRPVAPAQSGVYMDFIKRLSAQLPPDQRSSIGWSIPYAEAFLAGWHTANLRENPPDHP